ncbi:MAG: BrnA antitoxin family protein [Candidatus Rokubacteria bacterium]|nr:BrnA antitoxin family protein [Candidatus Rokubacteria bacterium]
MRKEFDFSKARRSEFWKHMPPPDQLARHTKERITIFIDLDILNFFRARAAKRGKPPYQTQINQALREYMEGSPPPGKGALVADEKLISRLAERIAEYSTTKRKKRRAKKAKA